MKFPKIDSPCPLRWKALPTADKNFCTQCERQVHNLSDMTEQQRRQFLASCNGKVCIAYTVSRARPLAAMHLGLGMLAAIVATPALAQEATHEGMSPRTGVQVFAHEQPAHVVCDDTNARAEKEFFEAIVVAGGVTDPQNVRWVEGDAGRPTLPVVQDDAFLDAQFIEAPDTLGMK